VAGPAPDLDRALVAITVVLVAAHLCGALLDRLHQPRVVGEMIGGILLGPSVLGSVWPGAAHALFPGSVMPVLNVLAQLGVVFFMFHVGLEINLRTLRSSGRAAAVVGYGAMAVPFAAGALLGWSLPASYRPPGTGHLPFALFAGLSMCVSALPVLASILRQRQLIETPAGVLGLTAACICDVTAWCLLALLLATAGRADQSSGLRTVALAAGFAVVMMAVVRPGLERALSWGDRRDGSRHAEVALLTCYVLLCALLSDRIGVHPVFGAMLAGAITPRQFTSVWEFTRTTDGLVTTLLLPLFFASVGLSTHLEAIAGVSTLLVCGLVLLVAVAAKGGGTTLAALIAGRQPREAIAVGVMLNCRGLTEMVILNLGLSLGLIGSTFFSIMMVTTLATTLATAPLLDLAYPRPAARNAEDARRLKPEAG
jgi:Kef-type K+ transport system membrane component KefB